MAQYLSWCPAGAMELKELDEFLLARAMEHDSPTLLLRLACEYVSSMDWGPRQGWPTDECLQVCVVVADRWPRPLA